MSRQCQETLKTGLPPVFPQEAQVPSSPEWFHEVKQDGFRLRPVVRFHAHGLDSRNEGSNGDFSLGEPPYA
jgi:hypothetical protein